MNNKRKINKPLTKVPLSDTELKLIMDIKTRYLHGNTMLKDIASEYNMSLSILRNYVNMAVEQVKNIKINK